MLRKTRIILAALMMTFITLLLLDITGVLHHYLGWMAKIQFLSALLALNVGIVFALIIVTLIFGRIYCSVICPLGIMQDLISWIHGKRKKNRFNFSPEKKWIRYPVLVVFIVAIIAGIGSFVALLAPYSAYGRIVVNLLKPIYEAGNNLLASMAEHFNSYAFYHVDIWIKSMPTLIIAACTFVIIAILAWRGGRTYCNTICPVGTILSFFARFSWLRIQFDTEKCRNCSKCSKNCKASCIDYKNHQVDYSRCVACGNCLESCNFGALSYRPVKLKKQESAKHADSSAPSHDASRRSFLLGTALATTATALSQAKKKVDGGLAKIEEKVAPQRATPITPPGSLSASNMQRHCTACQLCVSACPNQVLRPSTGLLTMMQPTMSYELGYCRPECNRCSQVCPAGAIKPITKEEKVSTQVGHAVWIKKNCIPVTEGVECGNCERHCPAGAIEMVPLDPDDEMSVLIPAVNETKCIGCGACENLCPARPFSAIYVEGHEVHKTL
jgi:polyferredoxin